MGLEELKKQITKDMQERVAQLQSHHEAQSKELLAQALAQVKTYAKQKEEDAQRQIAEMNLREEALVELEGNKCIQEAKKAAIDEALLSLTKKLAILSEKERKAIITSLAAKAAKEIDVAQVYVHPDDVQHYKGAKPENILGGLIAENKDGSIRVDYSFDSLLQEFSQEMLTSVSQRLFTP